MKHRRSLAILLACGLATLGLPSLLTCGPAPAAATPSPTAPIPPDAEMLAPGVWACPDDLTGAAFVGSTEAGTYYFLDCTQAAFIDAAVRICFASAGAARDYGYRPCNHCP